MGIPSGMEDSKISLQDDSVSVLDDHSTRIDETSIMEVRDIAKFETRNVQFSRRFAQIMLFVAGAAVTGITYYRLKSEAIDDFESAFSLFALTIEDAVHLHAAAAVSSVVGVSHLLSSHSQSQSQPQSPKDAGTSTWPMVTMPDFEASVQTYRKQAKLKSIITTPLLNVSQVAEWNTYSLKNQWWIDESKDFRGEDRFIGSIRPLESTETSSSSSSSQADETDTTQVDLPMAPVWQVSPLPDNPRELINYGGLLDQYKQQFTATLNGRSLVLGRASGPLLKDILPESEYQTQVDDDHPHTVMIYPVFERLKDPSSQIVSLVWVDVVWDRFLEDLLQDETEELDVVLKNNCGQSFTYKVQGNKQRYVGPGDLHETKYDVYEYRIELAEALGGKEKSFGAGDCLHTIYVYPTSSLDDSYATATPLILAAVVAATFFVMAFTFCVYDVFVGKKNNKITHAAVQSNAILSTLFPSTVRDRLFQHHNDKEEEKNLLGLHGPGKHRLKTFLTSNNNKASPLDDDDSEIGFAFKNKPIADLFPETTIMFADLVGFTAWSSSREPSQVFTLLESIYRAFDVMAQRRQVFKVETVGDCYVAVTGLPDPQPDHALIMVRFAQACFRKLADVTHDLEVSLGPDTSNLSMRFGLHSGPVTAGVLRGDRSRFQLFGDTMNTASRMESTGAPGRIHISEDTANLLIGTNKEHLVRLREDKVSVKGKGEMQTYWVEDVLDTSQDNVAVTSLTTMLDQVQSDDPAMVAVMEDLSVNGTLKSLSSERTARLIDWNTAILSRLLQQVHYVQTHSTVRTPRSIMKGMSRKVSTTLPSYKGNGSSHGASPSSDRGQHYPETNKTVLDEVQEIITLPDFKGAYKGLQQAAEIPLDEKVQIQLRDYVTNVAALYRDNPFHNFEHASHVTQSVLKLLGRIVAPADVDPEDWSASVLHDHTYGITSDPLTQFACVFSAMIHDLDHPGVPNAQMLIENPQLAATYKQKSVAEQNSVDMAWDLLMDEEYGDLRQAIYGREVLDDGSPSPDFVRFRQLVVNSVMATDIVDKDLKALRNARWDRAFADHSLEPEQAQSEKRLSARQNVHRKATIVIEHLIQASDVAHTMQHWHVYRKWNQRLFQEMSLAYQNGRSQSGEDPAIGWYEGEIGFFDYYIIPLAKKLKECGVFGVSSDEYLNYALKNREEWATRGREVVAEMVEERKAMGSRDS